MTPCRGRCVASRAAGLSAVIWTVDSSWNVMAHGDAWEGTWRGNWRMECVASTLHTTSENGVSSIITVDAHTSAASSRLNWRPRRFKWTHPLRRKTKSGFCACAITFQLTSTWWFRKRRIQHAFGFWDCALRVGGECAGVTCCPTSPRGSREWLPLLLKEQTCKLFSKNYYFLSCIVYVARLIKCQWCGILHAIPCRWSVNEW